mmetsp:Transcript_40259/g.104398  ORF Transcript_40259/g.104398 Transcript_40259/m.104398 type:complete len:95 (-) Transcript_40259:1046-1330(-)
MQPSLGDIGKCHHESDWQLWSAVDGMRGGMVECLMSKSIWAIGKKDILQASLSRLFFQERPLFRIENEFNKGESEKNKSMQKKRLSWWWFVGQK